MSTPTPPTTISIIRNVVTGVADALASMKTIVKGTPRPHDYRSVFQTPVDMAELTLALSTPS